MAEGHHANLVEGGTPAALVSDFVVTRLVELGVRHVFGVGGANIEDLFSAVQRRRPVIGVSGAMGHAAVVRALRDARVVVIAGTRLPLLARQGLEAILREKTLVSLGAGPPFVAAAQQIHLTGDLSNALRDLVERIAAAPARAVTPAGPYAQTQAVTTVESSSFTTASVVGAVERLAPEGSVVLADAGNTGASSAHYVRAPRGGRFLLAMGMAGMGYAFGGATGAAFATGKRCIVLAGDGAFFMHGLEIHTAVEHSLPITYVLFDNRAHGMCLVRERLLLGENAGYNAFRRSHLGAGLAAMFPDLSSVDCSTLAHVEAALAASFSRDGPSVICAEMSEVEIPPFAALQEKAGDQKTVPRGDAGA